MRGRGRGHRVEQKGACEQELRWKIGTYLGWGGVVDRRSGSSCEMYVVKK